MDQDTTNTDAKEVKGVKDEKAEAKAKPKSKGKNPGRRPPGRPRKKPLKEPMKREGVKTAPLNVENCMEMIYDAPSVFKRIFAFLKSMAVKKMQMVFDKTTIDIISADHMGKSSIKISIDCTKINHYYCAEKMCVNVHPTSMEKIIKILDKNYTSVAFISKTLTKRSNLIIIFKNDSVKIDEYREINLVKVSDIQEASFETTGYPIRFTLPARYFKKVISDIDSFSTTLTICKAGKDNLLFKHTSTDKNVSAKYVVQDAKSIELVSTISNDDIFSSSVEIDYVKPLSSNLLADFVQVFAHSHKNMIFKIRVDRSDIQEADRAILIQVNTKTVKLKK